MQVRLLLGRPKTVYNKGKINTTQKEKETVRSPFEYVRQLAHIPTPKKMC